jgi:hypothetical protein
MIIALCLTIAIASILFLIGWFFNSINEAQRRIDKETEE